MKTPLNWKEIKLLCEWISKDCRGEHFSRIFVPTRPELAGTKFLKREWVLEWSRHYWTLSLRNRSVYFAWTSNKLKPHPGATLSPFELELNKLLKGTKFLSAETIENDRIALFHLAKGGKTFTLRFIMFPAHPELHILDDSGKILSSSKLGKDWQSKTAGAPKDLDVRDSFLKGSKAYNLWIENEIRSEILEGRHLLARQTLDKQIVDLKKSITQTQKTLQILDKEPPFQKWGDLVKASLYEKGTIKNGQITVMDYYQDPPHKIEIPCQAGLSLPDQVQAFYKKSKRHARKLQEESEHLGDLETRLDKLSSLDPENLSELEIQLGLSNSTPNVPKIKKSSWEGKTFLTKQGFQIWMGRKKEENIELTFKHAKGNDLWFHLRGRPGCHAIIPLRDGKSAPLETLLDAAELCLFYSGGADWSKVEVDYTFRKNVKKIPKSTEVTYSQNKTLVVNPDPKRRARLLESSLQFLTPQKIQRTPKKKP